MWFIVVVVIMGGTLNEAARILGYFPVPSFSHQLTFRCLTEELLERGHEVTVVTSSSPFLKKKPTPNLTEIDVRYDVLNNKLKNNYVSTVTGNINTVHEQIKIVLSLFDKVHEKLLQNEEIKDIIKNKNDTFDLVLLELNFSPGWVLAHLIKAPTILISSIGGVYRIYDILGASNHIFLYPYLYRGNISNLSFWEKIKTLYSHYQLQKILEENIASVNELNRKLIRPDIPSLSESIRNVEMFFVNVHPLWEDNRPVPPNVVYMGKIHIKPLKELPEELKTYLDSSKNGVIYISFGTNVIPSMLAPERIQVLINVFSKLPYDVLWKYDKDELSGKSENIRIEKWLPQSDLLRHPKIKLFITQGGLQSTDEAIAAGVPLIGIPMLGDQWYNVEHYIQHKIGVRLDMESITEETFMNAIKTILNDDSYHQNIVRLRELMNDQPQRPLEKAVWWAEHVIRHKGAKHLKSSATNLTWAQYYEVELICIVLFSLLTLLLIVSVAIYFLWKYISRKFNPVKLKSS